MCTFLNFFKRAEQEHQLGVCVGKHRDVFNACYMVKKKKKRSCTFVPITR